MPASLSLSYSAELYIEKETPTEDHALLIPATIAGVSILSKVNFGEMIVQRYISHLSTVSYIAHESCIQLMA